jgi:ribosomal protein S14
MEDRPYTLPGAELRRLEEEEAFERKVRQATAKQKDSERFLEARQQALETRGACQDCGEPLGYHRKFCNPCYESRERLRYLADDFYRPRMRYGAP